MDGYQRLVERTVECRSGNGRAMVLELEDGSQIEDLSSPLDIRWPDGTVTTNPLSIKEVFDVTGTLWLLYYVRVEIHGGHYFMRLQPDNDIQVRLSRAYSSAVRATGS